MFVGFVGCLKCCDWLVDWFVVWLMTNQWLTNWLVRCDWLIGGMVGLIKFLRLVGLNDVIDWSVGVLGGW